MKEPSIKKNFVYSTAYQILNVITPFITAPYVSRVLGAEGIGIQSYTASVQYIFLLIASLGTLSYGSREISMHRDDVNERSKLFWEIELMVICTTGIALFGWVFLCLFSPRYKIFYCVLSIGIFANMFDITWFFNGIEQFKLTVIRNSAFKIIGIVLLFIFIKSKDDLLLYIFITAFTSLLSNVSLWPYMKRYVVKVDFRKLSFKRHFKETLVYFIPTIATSVYTVLDKTLLGLITSDVAQNGYYQQAEKIINLAKSVVFTAINSVVGVRNAYLFAEKDLMRFTRKLRFHSTTFSLWDLVVASELWALQKRSFRSSLDRDTIKWLDCYISFRPSLLLSALVIAWVRSTTRHAESEKRVQTT